MKKIHWTLTLFMSGVVFLAPPLSAEEEAAPAPPSIEEDLTPPPPLPVVVSPKIETTTSTPDPYAEELGEEKNLLLKDGTRVQGKVIRVDAEFIVLKTPLGELAVPRSEIQPTFLRLEFPDGNVIVGELLAENEDSFLINGVFGELEIKRDQIVGFERAYFKDQLAHIPGSTFGTGESMASQDKVQRGQRFSHSDIEPLIDIFFDPTGYTFRKGDIYVSGLSIGYGFTDNFHSTVNVLELVGLNGLGAPNLRATAKWKFFERKNAKREWLMAAVLAGDAWTRLGTTHTIINDANFTRTATNSDENADPEDRNWELESQGETTSTVQRSSNFFGDDNFEPQDSEEFGFTDLEVDETNHYCYSDTDPAEELDITARCYSDGSNSVAGPRGELYLANTYSWLLQRGGRFGWHNGVKLSVDSLNYQNWTSDPTYRVYTAFDLDLNHKFKLLGELFYDPSYKALFTDVEDFGMDFGMLYAFTPAFRVLVHLDAPFVGLYWRF